ncbi:MAG: hypothetical protein ABII88_05165 [Candidatus Omnitrophota bacterium]
MKKNEDFSFVNISLYLNSLYISAFLFGIGWLGSRQVMGELSILMILGGLGLLFVAVYIVIMLYRLWKFVIEESLNSGLQPSIESPGAAVGQLFIPFYNFYWVFICLRGLSRDLNALAAQRNISARLSIWLGTVISICALPACIPYVRSFVSPITTLILCPLYFYKVAIFARNLRIHTQTGKNLFVAGGIARQKMALVRNYSDIFLKTHTHYPVIGMTILLGLIWVGFVFLFWQLVGMFGIRAMFFMPMLLAGLLVYVIQRLKSAFLVIGSLTVVSGMAGLSESIMMNSYDWFYLSFLFAVSFMYGLFFRGLFPLTIRTWGVRWWGIALAFLGSFCMFPFIGVFFPRITYGTESQETKNPF